MEWRPPPADQQNGVILGYKVYYLKTEEGMSDSDADSVEVTDNEATLTSLEIWTEYKIWVVAFTAAGDSPQSPPIYVKTHESGRYSKQDADASYLPKPPNLCRNLTKLYRSFMLNSACE